MPYQQIVTFWIQQHITDESALAATLDSYCIDFAYHSGKIENDAITYYDTREIFDKDGVTSYTGNLRTLYEIRNAKDAYRLMLRAFAQHTPITEQFAKEMQKQLTKNTYDTHRYQQGERPGSYKLHDYVTGPREVGAPACDVAEEMAELLEELQDIPDGNALTAAAYFHAKFENIHPFSDGNGRTGRLLMNYFLLCHNHPPIVIHEEDRKEYYAALDQFDSELDLMPLKEFLIKQLEKTWQRSIEKSDRAEIRQVSFSDFNSLSASATERAKARQLPTDAEESPQKKHGSR